MDNIIKIKLYDDIDTSELFGNLDRNVKIVEESFGTEIIQREGDITVKGENAERAARVIRDMMGILADGEDLDSRKIRYVISLNEKGMSYRDGNIEKDIICYTHTGRPLKPKTLGQKQYVDQIRRKDVVFGIGPAGTGKTYIAVAMAVTAYKKKQVQKIILTRPAVEAGERLGFLPGDLQEKVDPYLRPLYDALYDVLGRESSLRLKEKELIEVVPLAYMRGRTLDNAFIILDEAQNTTREQMKMALTRLGFGSKMIVTGDLTQIDLPKGKKSGLKEACRALKKVEGIGFSYLKDVDVVRHHLVTKIVNAYDIYYKNNPEEDA